MGDIAIRVEGISKKFNIGRRQESYKTLRDTLMETFLAPFRKAGKLLRGQASGAAELDETIWALNDISFEIKSGEIIGIIGRNGSGKSTLLKILSRITEPTSGYAEIRGRVGSLLEVGTGFHPELTGRENIYLNGAILGMRRAEIIKNFDEIVAFAEVEKFIDTPVKHYSSGMYLRLAFAVAAHLEPEILIVDEVLAVGDAQFQKKCLNKMKDVGQEGRTVLFVSHNMPAITRLCERAILIDEGRVLHDDKSHKVVSNYLSYGVGIRAVWEWDDPREAPGDDVVRLRAIRVQNEDGQIPDSFDIRKPIGIHMEYEVLQPGHLLVPNFNVYNEEGLWLFTTHDQDPAWRRCPRPRGRYVSTAWIPGNFLSEGMLFIEPAMMTSEPFIPHFREANTIAIHIVDNHDGNSARGDWRGHIGGLVRPLLQWTTQFNPDEAREVSTVMDSPAD
jgi:lipopolysaccharide transport system ATP-binding protein